MAVKIKICGITNLDDAILASELGADALGFVFYNKSPRYIPPPRAREIINELPPFVSSVGVFVNEDRDTVIGTASDCALNAIQLSGDEPPDFLNESPFKVIRTIRVSDGGNLDSINLYPKGTSLILDTYHPVHFGGTGLTFDWNLMRRYIDDYRIIIAGGLVPENVGVVVGEFRPFGVDVSSGVESRPGKKDPVRLRSFIKNAILAQEKGG